MADSDGMPDPLRTTPGFDMVAATTFGSLAFLRDSLMEVSAPQASLAAFIEGAAIARSKNPSEV
jgi:hypothetical protein